jgi:NTP pyrophosphatase (non-canonical NTP hydrolase)
MQLDDYQLQARRSMHPGLSPCDALLDAVARLAEESGEVPSHVRKHLFFEKPLDTDAAREEPGDALWCLAAVATRLNISLGEVAARSLEKIDHRVQKDQTAATAD